MTVSGITELKSMSKPPQLVKDTLTALLIQLNYEISDSKDYKLVARILGQKQVLPSILSYDYDVINPAAY